MRRLVPILLDLLIVVIFAIIGRTTHARGLSFGGIVETAWPFLVACLVAWLVISLLATEGARLRAALIVWLLTVPGGTALRVSTGNTADIAFFLVAFGLLGAAFFGWRLIAIWLDRRRSVAS